MKDLHWYVENTTQPLRGCVVFLPGRHNFGYSMLRSYSRVLNWEGIGMVAVTPRLDEGWYPPPRSPIDQQRAVLGLNIAAKTVEKIIRAVVNRYGVGRDKIILSGFSMGAVAAVHWATRCKQTVASVVCHSGAILEPWNVPAATHDMPIILNHSMDDGCFDWEERYLPMKRALTRKNYNVWHLERPKGDHLIHHFDVECLQGIFEGIYGGSMEWQPYWAA